MLQASVLVPRAPVAGKQVSKRATRLIAASQEFDEAQLRRALENQGKGGIADLMNSPHVDLAAGLAGEPSLGNDDPLNYDPEGLYRKTTTIQEGHISRRMAFRNAASKEEAEKELQRQKEKALEEADQRRQQTPIPADPGMLVDFLLNCGADDIEFFIAKCRPQLGKEFFAALDAALGHHRFSNKPDQDAIAELEGLRNYITEHLAAQDTVKEGVAAAKQRLEKLLTAKDKKQCILDMASANEIDLALIQLLQQNIDGATAAGRADIAGFMTKIRDAASKYVILPQRNDTPEEEAVEKKPTIIMQ